MWSWARSYICQLLEEGQATNISLRKSRSFLRSSRALSSRSVSAKIPIQGVGPRLLEEKNSHGYPSQNSFFREILIRCGQCFLHGSPTLLSLVSSLQSFSIIFKMIWTSIWATSVIQSKPDCPISAFLTPTPGETYPFTLISFPLSRTACGELLGPLDGYFLIPP
jgi:hypothetical protein